MATWRIDDRSGTAVLTYLSPEKTVECGRVDMSALSDLEGWVADQAIPGDIVVSPSGRFIKQAAARC